MRAKSIRISEQILMARREGKGRKKQKRGLERPRPKKDQMTRVLYLS
jgi:hypothetical protein